MSATTDKTDTAINELSNRYKADPKRIKRLLACLADGNVRLTAVKASGIIPDTFYKWLEASPAFAALVEEAEASALSDCVGIVKKAASPHKVTKRKTVTKDGAVISDEVQETREYDWRAAAWLLERKDPANWKERKEIDLSNLTNEQLLALWESATPENGDAAPGPVSDGGAAEPAGPSPSTDDNAIGVDRVGAPESTAPAQGLD